MAPPPHYRYYSCNIECPHLKARDLTLTEDFDVAGDMTVSGDILEASIPSISFSNLAINEMGPWSVGDQIGSTFTTETASKNIKALIFMTFSVYLVNNPESVHTIPFSLQYNDNNVWTTQYDFEIKQHLKETNVHYQLSINCGQVLTPNTEYRIVYENGDADIETSSDDVAQIMIAYLGYA